MKHLANISQFEQIQNSALTENGRWVWNDNNDSGINYDQFIPDSYRNLDHSRGAGAMLGDNTAAPKENIPKGPEWGKYNSIGDIMLALQTCLSRYFKETKDARQKLIYSIKGRDGSSGILGNAEKLINVMKHPAARKLLGVDDKEVNRLAGVVRDFSGSFKKQIYDNVYGPISDTCYLLTQKIKEKDKNVPSSEGGWISQWLAPLTFGLSSKLFGSSLRDQYLKSLKEKGVKRYKR